MIKYEDSHSLNYQKSEIGDMKWFTLEEALQRIRDYNIEKKDLLLSLNDLLKNNIIPENNKQTNGGIMRLIPVILFSLNDSDYMFEKKIIEINKKYSDFQKIALNYGSKYLNLMNKKVVAQNIINIYQENKK